tara:strand:- start:119 stop:376 length:258 start_codon:yes stop_codon:yes gene_type:complete
MDIIQIIETLGIPVAVAVGLGWGCMYLIKFITKDVAKDLKGLYEIIVKLIDTNRIAKDEIKKTMASVNTMKDLFIKLLKKDRNNG